MPPSPAISDLVDARVLTDAGAPGASSRGPGVYEALRSSAGPELSQAIGLSFFLAFTADAAFNALGFAQAFGHSLGPGAAGWLAGWMPLEQALGSAALLCFTLLCFYGVRLSGRLSLLMLMALLASLAASLVCIALPSNEHLAGHIALSGARLAANFAPQLSSPRGGVLSFALLFPGFTGVIAGAWPLQLTEALPLPAQLLSCTSGLAVGFLVCPPAHESLSRRWGGAHRKLIQFCTRTKPQALACSSFTCLRRHNLALRPSCQYA